MAVWIFGGVAGAGKSTLAKAVAQARAYAFLDADDFHPEANRLKMRSGQPLDEADREPWLAALGAALARRASEPLVVAFPSLKEAHRRRLEEALSGTPVHWAWLEIGPDVAAARLRARGGFFPATLLPSQFEAREAHPAATVLDAEAEPAALLAAALAWMKSKHA